MKQDWSKHFLLRSEQKTFFFSLKQRGSPANKRTLEKTAISLEGSHLHTITCGTATYTKMIWIPLFLHLLASSAVVSVVSISFQSSVINVNILINLKKRLFRFLQYLLECFSISFLLQ